MRPFIVGTAGHIDHGKSALVRALTGTDPDRLKEEKERGITIDLGFAHAALAEDVEISFVDVPGHERFVKNMLAGAHGIDAVMLVVAADESVMPQTREHLDICRLLGIPRGLVVLTICDLALAELQETAAVEVRELVAGSFLDGAPLLRVATPTGDGLPALRGALLEMARRAPPRPVAGLMRLPVDRVFTMRGFGTVATGTLVSGVLSEGDEVEVLPSGRRGRARGLQVHGGDVETASAGSRVAVNLAGLAVADLARGDVLAHPGTLRTTSILDVQVSLLPGARPLADQTRLRIHAASAEVLGRVRFPGGRALAPGSEGWAQLRLEGPAAATRGDRLILRAYSPAATIGGALVLDPLPRKRRSSEEPDVGRALALARGDAAEAAATILAGEAGRGLDLPALSARVGEPSEPLLRALSGNGDVVSLGRDPVVLVARGALEALGRRVVAAVAEFHRDSPLKAAMPREELRQRLARTTTHPVFDRALQDRVAAGELQVGDAGVSLARHRVTLSVDEQDARQALEAAARAARLEGIETARVAAASGKDPRTLDRVARVLSAEGVLRRVGDVWVDGRALDALVDEVRRRWPPGSRLDVGEFKALTGLTRRFVIPLLEHLDATHVTRRSGNERFTVSSR